jgi:hypothetical protein
MSFSNSENQSNNHYESNNHYHINHSSENNNNNDDYDLSDNNCIDISFNINLITDLSLNQTITGNGYKIMNQQGFDLSGNEVTNTIFLTTDISSNVQINENLTGIVETFYDDETNTENGQIVDQIKSYAKQIQCSEFHGKGTIDDYTELFIAASKIANESKQMTLDVDIDGFNEFAQAADDMSNLFTSFIKKLQNVNIINDTSFLQTILLALEKIVNLSKIFGKFKETILATSTIQIPKSAHDTSIVLQGVMDEINCAMNYISYFVDSSNNKPYYADLSDREKKIITKAVDTIDNWNVLCDQGVSVALSSNVDLKFINNASNELKTKTNNLKSYTQTLKNKFKNFDFITMC